MVGGIFFIWSQDLQSKERGVLPFTFWKHATLLQTNSTLLGTPSGAFEPQNQGEQQVSKQQRPHGRYQSYYKSSNLINRAMISKITTSTLIRGPAYSD